MRLMLLNLILDFIKFLKYELIILLKCFIKVLLFDRLIVVIYIYFSIKIINMNYFLYGYSIYSICICFKIK